MTFTEQTMLENREAPPTERKSEEFVLSPEVEHQIKYLRMDFKNPNLYSTQEALVMQDTLNGINSVKRWVAYQSIGILPEGDYEAGPIDKRITELISETAGITNSLINMFREISVYNNTGVAQLRRVAFQVEPNHNEFLDIPIEDLEGLKAFLQLGVGIYIHDIKSPITTVYGFLEIIKNKKSAYKTASSIINKNILRINNQIDKGALDLVANLKFEDKGVDLDMLRETYYDIIDSKIVEDKERIGPVERLYTVDEDVKNNIIVHGNNFWYRYLASDVGKNLVNVFLSRDIEEEEKAKGNESKKNKTPDGVDYSTIPDCPEEADLSGIPEMLKDRSKKTVVYRVCKSKDGHLREVRIYDNAIGYKKRIIELGFLLSEEEGIHGYNTKKVHSQGSVMSRHTKVMNKFGIDVIPAFVRDREGKVVPKAGLTIIRFSEKEIAA